jgi:hypothetical protein
MMGSMFLVYLNLVFFVVDTATFNEHALCLLDYCPKCALNFMYSL